MQNKASLILARLTNYRRLSTTLSCQSGAEEEYQPFVDRNKENIQKDPATYKKRQAIIASLGHYKCRYSTLLVFIPTV